VELVLVTLPHGDGGEGSRTIVLEVPFSIRGCRSTSAHARFTDLAARTDHVVTKVLKIFSLDSVR
jgi:hypothetical protein